MENTEVSGRERKSTKTRRRGKRRRRREVREEGLVSILLLWRDLVVEEEREGVGMK